MQDRAFRKIEYFASINIRWYLVVSGGKIKHPGMGEFMNAVAESDNVRIHAVVTGLVQGVGFRYFTVMTAHDIGVSGWVRNRYDGSVEVEAQGSRSSIARLVTALKAGPKWSQVENVEVQEIPLHHNVDPIFQVYRER